MAALRDEVRQELSRLHGLLRGELGEESGSGRLDLGQELSSDIAAELGSDARELGSNVHAIGGDHGTGSDDDVSTAIGTIPPYTTSSVGVLPFGDRSAGGPANGRSFAFELVPGHAVRARAGRGRVGRVGHVPYQRRRDRPDLRRGPDPHPVHVADPGASIIGSR